MRMLFNHGISADQLYVNTPEKITTKNKQWFLNLYGDFKNREDALSAPFRYCMGLIFNKILDEKVRFKIPVISNAYIDFEVIGEDLFELYKQRGAFPEVDFIESDFTGYYLRYFYQSKSYQKKLTIHLGGKLKEKFLQKINSGEKLYSTKDFTLDDIFKDVHARFKELDKAELKRILLHGFRRMHSAILFGCYMSITSKRFINCFAFFGELSTNPINQAKMYNFRIIKKIRKINIWKKQIFDGYYYIGLNPKLLDEWVLRNKGNRVFTTFENVMIRSILDELVTKAQKLYIFKFKVKKWEGFMVWKDNLKVRDVEFIGESNAGKFTKIDDKTWRQLIKENMNLTINNYE